MAERPGHSMRSDKAAPTTAQQPQTRNELQAWVRDRLSLEPSLETALINAIDTVFTRHERLWQESKQEAIQALSAGFADKMAHVQTELSAKDATVSSISRYFASRYGPTIFWRRSGSGRARRICTPASAATSSAS